MKIKSKLNLGVGLLFLLIILLASVGMRQVYRLSSDTKNILTANYQSLIYARNMLQAIDGTDDDIDGSLKTLRDNVAKQANNVTEVGEAEFSQNLLAHLSAIEKNHRDSLAISKLRNSLNSIMRLNLDAIQRKSAVAEKTAESAFFWLGLIGTVCFLIAFTLLFNLPESIAGPIRNLTESIRQVAAGNYTQRVHFESHDEFGELAKSFNIMAEKLEEYNSSNLAKLMTEKKRIETLINNMHDPVFGLDENKRILFANHQALSICGLKPDEAIGVSALELSITNDLIRSLMQDIVQDKGQPIKTKVSPLKIYADGKESYFEKDVLDITLTPTGEKLPRSIGHVVMLRNVTAYKELDSAKTNLIATISHEFKTPISSIKMSLQLLENGQLGPLNEEQSSLLHSIHDDANRLLNITGELLNMAQVESGNIQISTVPTDAEAIVRRAVEATKNQAGQKRIELRLDCPAEIPLVMADEDKTTWVLTNLIANAVRYSEENAQVTLALRRDGETVLFEVKDQGRGIAPQHLPRVFDRYFRVPGSNTEGTGLGLSICKEFIEAQGGSVSAESEYGVGSVFAFRLPTAEHFVGQPSERPF